MMKTKISITLPFLLSSLLSFSQLVDFENLPHLIAGSSVGSLTAPNSSCSIEFLCGKDLTSTKPLTLQRVGYQNDKGGFYGPEFDVDCEGFSIPSGWSNQVNTLPYALNPSITNRERIGCYFISTILKGNDLPSIFIVYESGTTSCSADLIDVDGHDNTIEAYDIYYYAEKADFPTKPINVSPIEIRAKGKTFGPGALGDNGGVLPFKIESSETFKLIEIRPIQRVDKKNYNRLEFGFALDNFSPCQIEKIVQPRSIKKSDLRLIEPIITDSIRVISQMPTISSVYFDFDSDLLTSEAKTVLDQLIALNTKKTIKFIYLSGFTDPKGSDAYNLALSKRRVEAVKSYLLQHGFKEEQLKTRFLGEGYEGNPTDEDWQKRSVKIRLE